MCLPLATPRPASSDRMIPDIVRLAKWKLVSAESRKRDSCMTVVWFLCSQSCHVLCCVSIVPFFRRILSTEGFESPYRTTSFGHRGRIFQTSTRISAKRAANAYSLWLSKHKFQELGTPTQAPEFGRRILCHTKLSFKWWGFCMPGTCIYWIT